MMLRRIESLCSLPGRKSEFPVVLLVCSNPGQSRNPFSCVISNKAGLSRDDDGVDCSHPRSDSGSASRHVLDDLVAALSFFPGPIRERRNTHMTSCKLAGFGILSPGNAFNFQPRYLELTTGANDAHACSQA